MMDKTEQLNFSHIPVQSLTLRLARATIKMQHAPHWTIDKVNPVHDLIICLTGRGIYRFEDLPEPVTLTPGQAILVPAFTRFRGAHGGGDAPFTGVAQHFTLDLFRRGDLLQGLSLKRSATLADWDVLGPLAAHYRAMAPVGTTTLGQHHQFMVLLLAYLEAAFEGWKTPQDSPETRDHLSVQIMLAAARLSADPLGAPVDEILADFPYNPDYFRRAFKQRIGLTPQKFREMKRMEFAASRLGMGLRVNEVAAELGYSDPYFFSRQFKVYLGSSPSAYRSRADADPKAT